MAQPSFDPQQLPIEAIAGEAAVAPERLAPAWLRSRFVTPPVWTPEGSARALPGREDRAPTPASVLIPLVQRAHGEAGARGQCADFKYGFFHAA